MMSFYLYARTFITEKGPFTVKFPEHIILNGIWKVSLVEWRLTRRPEPGGVFILADICDWCPNSDMVNKVHKKAQLLRWTNDIGNYPCHSIYVPVIVKEFDTITFDIINAISEDSFSHIDKQKRKNFTILALHFKKMNLTSAS